MDKIDEMLEGGVKMSLFLKGYDIIKVGMIYVSINTEKPFQNCLCYRDEVSWKWHTYNTWELHYT